MVVIVAATVVAVVAGGNGGGGRWRQQGAGVGSSEGARWWPVMQGTN